MHIEELTFQLYTLYLVYVHVYVFNPGLILGLRPASERRRYFVTTSLIGWVKA